MSYHFPLSGNEWRSIFLLCCALLGNLFRITERKRSFANTTRCNVSNCKKYGTFISGLRIYHNRSQILVNQFVMLNFEMCTTLVLLLFSLVSLSSTNSPNHKISEAFTDKTIPEGTNMGALQFSYLFILQTKNGVTKPLTNFGA